MDKENELDSMQGISDEKMTELFNASIEIENEISRIKNGPIARYDVIKKKHILNIPTEELSMQKKPEIIVFAGPNGSGKTTVTKLAVLVLLQKENLQT